MTSIDELLRMDHLHDAPSVAQHKAQVEQAQRVATAPATEKAPTEADPRDSLLMSFHFTFTDGRGKVYAGDFVNEILNFGQRSKVGILASRLNGNIPIEQLDPDTAVLNRALAHLTFSLKVRPKWADKLDELHDLNLLMALWTRVIDHENYFFRSGPTEASG